MTSLVDRFGSRWVEVEVHAEAEHFLWCRRPGPDGPATFPVVHPHTSTDPEAAVELVAPSIDGSTLTYRVGGPSAAAAWLRQPDPAFLDTALDAVHRAAGAVHRATADPSAGPPSSGLTAPAPLRRLAAHLDDPDPSDAVTRWRTALRDALSPDAVTALQGTLTTHLGGAARRCHGGLSIGGIIPSTTALPTAVLSGEDWGRAAPGHDLGWLAGELLELAHSSPPGSALHQRLTTTVATLLAGTEDPDGVAAAAALRVALHAEDFAHHVGWDDTLLSRAILLRSLQHDDTWLRTGHLA